MTKYITVILMLCLCTSTANAQLATKLFGIKNAPVEKWEGELFGGLAFQLGDSESGSKKAGWGAGAEVRYNFPTKPLDVGLRFAHATTIASFHTYQLNSIMAVGDWNFLRGSAFDPFAGVGAGIALPSDISGNAKFSFMPRVGLEYNDWLRLTASAQFSSRYYHDFQVSLGFVLGGRKKFDMADYLAKMSPEYKESAPAVVQQPLSEDAQRLYNLMKEERKYQSRGTAYGILGGVSLGIGAFLATNGIIAIASNDKHPVAVIYGVAFTSVGGLFTLGSVPLFIASHHQKVKAATISATIKPLISPNSTASPGVGLSLNF